MSSPAEEPGVIAETGVGHSRTGAALLAVPFLVLSCFLGTTPLPLFPPGQDAEKQPLPQPPVPWVRPQERPRRQYCTSTVVTIKRPSPPNPSPVSPATDHGYRRTLSEEGSRAMHMRPLG